MRLALGAAVHVFVGMIEAPLLVRPYLARMQRGELFALMTCGMAGVAGTVMVIYATFLAPLIPNALGNILIASVISTPAGLAVAALLVPFGPAEAAEERLVIAGSAAQRAGRAGEGHRRRRSRAGRHRRDLAGRRRLRCTVNAALGELPHWGDGAITLQRIFAWPFRPVMWLIGLPWSEAGTAATLMGTKTVLNEFVAYVNFSALPPDTFTPRSRLILTYALCGFANFGSLGIVIGGLGVMVPERRHEVVALGMRSILSGTLATCMSGAIAGVLAG